MDRIYAPVWRRERDLSCPDIGWPTLVVGGLAAWAPVALMLGLAWLLRD